MIRKHTRRAAKAAFAISLGVAIVLGGSATAATKQRAAAPTIVIGTKNFTEEYVLGQLYKQALEGAGFTVKFPGSFGSSELIDTAITSGKINFYPEYTGVIVLDLAKQTSPKTAAATYAAAKKFEETRGLTLLDATPFYDTDSFGMLTATAKKLGVKTIADMKKVQSFSFAGYPECRTRITCLLGLKQIYGLTQVKFVPLASISVYTLLDQARSRRETSSRPIRSWAARSTPCSWTRSTSSGSRTWPRSCRRRSSRRPGRSSPRSSTPCRRS